MKATLRKTHIFILFLLVASKGFSQQQSGSAATTIDPNAKQAVATNAAAAKTEFNWDIISELYQLSLNDLTGNSKSVTFAGTIKSFETGFQTPDQTKVYSYLENNFQPQVSLGYKNNFQSINTSFGFKLAVINQTDAAHSDLLNKSAVLLDYSNQLRDYESAFREAIRANAEKKQLDPAARKALLGNVAADSQEGKVIINAYMTVVGQELQQQEKELTQLILTRDIKKLTPDLQAIFNQTAAPGKSLAGFIKLDSLFNSEILTVSQKIANGWVININPVATYDITRGGFQGLNLGATGSKGLSGSKNTAYTTQIVGKFNYIVGADTIVPLINTQRHQITDQLGINQVLGSSIIRSVSTTTPTPWLEGSITGSYNYVFPGGLKPKEKSIQPALNLKLALLVGKSAWFTVPFTYNFGTHTGMALISVTANIGSSLF